MRVLIAHNHYQQRGGEDAVFEHETAMLERAGHEVHRYTVHNDAIDGFVSKAATFATTPYGKASREAFERELAGVGPDVVHVHNYFPLLTPSVFYACTARGIPVVHTLHNYRMLCANGLLLREGKICEKCVKGSPYWAVAHRCYRGSAVGSLALALMIGAQRRWKTWHEQVTRFIVLTQFERQKFIEAGVPEDRICLKPNFVPDPGVHASVPPHERSGVLYVGRLSAEKGLRTLIEAWRSLDVPLRIAGDGPLMDELRENAPSNVTLLGRLPSEKVHAEMARAALLVMPSNWYEGFPVTLVEALACGLPVAASRIGSLQEVVQDGKTGVLYKPNDPQDLARVLAPLVRDGKQLARMSSSARRCFEENYSADRNLDMLESIYDEARNASRTSSQHARTEPEKRVSGLRPVTPPTA